MLWNEKFAFGIEKIDQQHKNLFDLVERAQDLVGDAKEGLDCYDDIVAVLNELASYTVYHFDYEETELKNIHYSDYDAHLEEHTKFIEKVTAFLETDIDEDHIGVIIEVLNFLLSWISDHVLLTDTKYVGLLK